MPRPVLLVVLDGFGIGDGGASDATAAAHTPFFDRITERYPMARLETSGEAVGLPPGQMGNSEVGHMTMGAGRIVEQDMTRISNAIDRGDLDTNPAIDEALSVAERGRGVLHLLGLVSDGGVHSHVRHLEALLDLCGRRGVTPVVHAFLDGRDTPPRSGLGILKALLPQVDAAGGHVATLCGRYYAMDRDNRWERIALAYDALVCGEGQRAPNPFAAVEASYAAGAGDEFVEPTVIDGGARIEDGDPVVFFNYRADRAREITNALTNVAPELFPADFERKRLVAPGAFVCFAAYDGNYELPVAFPSHPPEDGLGEIVARAGYAQLRIAETEKYAHVTFFFNGGVEEPFPKEDRVLIASPRDVATYDHKPEMSAAQLTAELVDRIHSGDYTFILLNYANPDMVGHTGVLDAAIKAVETVDRGLEQICDAMLARGGCVIITADHGNCELMVDPETGEPHTAHTTNPVPIFWVSEDAVGRRLHDGGLADLAPTVLELLDIAVPGPMTGRSLIERS
jgi:2,3-bisphosphoglycerate-independent phosphoglycerate mutase